MRQRSPIERMVDAACGIPEGTIVGPTDPVTLVCEMCGAQRVFEREPDFFDFDIIETTCPRCTPVPQSGIAEDK